MNQFFGEHLISFHLIGLLFSLIGTLLSKYHFWKKHESEQLAKGNTIVFSRTFWFKSNILDVIAALITSFVFVRFIDIFLHWVNPKLKAMFEIEIPLTEDQIFYYFVAGVLFQVLIHTKYKRNNGR